MPLQPARKASSKVERKEGGQTARSIAASEGRERERGERERERVGDENTLAYPSV